MSIRMGRKTRHRPDLLPNPQPTYGFGKYPDRVRISFVDGNTKVYETIIEQPKPVFFTGTDLKRMSKTPGRYQYRGVGRK